MGCQEVTAYISKHLKLWTYIRTKLSPVKWAHKDTSCQLVQPCTDNVTTSPPQKKMYRHQYFFFQHCHQACLSILHSVGWDFPSHNSICHTLVMNVKFKHWFILDRNLKLLLLSYPGRDQSLTAANSTILVNLLLFNYAWTWQWPDQFTILLRMPDLSPPLYKTYCNSVNDLTCQLFDYQLSHICDWRNIVK